MIILEQVAEGGRGKCAKRMYVLVQAVVKRVRKPQVA
jgi:hypothetical protein